MENTSFDFFDILRRNMHLLFFSYLISNIFNNEGIAVSGTFTLDFQNLLQLTFP